MEERRDTLFSSFSVDAPSQYSPTSVYPPRKPWHPDASMLEFSDDSRSNSTYDDAGFDDDDDPQRMSIGPKMRFHSPAPWEEGEDSIPEDSSEYHHEPPRKKPFHFGAASSPRPSTDSRPSIESGRMKLRKPQETDKGPGRGALHALVQAGVNSSVITPPPHSLRIPSTRVENGQTQSPISISHFPSPPTEDRPPSPPRMDYMRRRSDSDSSSSNPNTSIHPFANPEVMYHRQEPIAPPSPARSTFSAMHVFPRSDSHSSPFSSSTSPMPTTPPSVRKWDISGPMPVQSNPGSNALDDSVDPRLLALMPRNQGPAFSNYPDNPAPPAFQLISLEEAREQRKRSQTADSASVISSGGYGDSQGNISDRASIRTRARTVSAGTKAKTALQSMVNSVAPPPERRDSESSSSGMGGKSLKHKKSGGFMRLFNGQKDRDAPPVPTLSETYSIHNAQNTSQVSRSDRVAFPPLSTGYLEPSYDDFNSDTPSSSSTTRHSPSRKVPPPLLFKSEASPDKVLSHSAEPHHSQTLSPSGTDRDRGSLTLPQSAPANALQFPALRLRPVSTTFSSKFGEQFISRDSQPSMDEDLSTGSTVSSPMSVMSPITPGLSSRSIPSDEKKSRASSTTSSSKHPDEQSAVVQSLQEQIVLAKKAWQRHIWELEGQVRDLKAEVQDLRAPNARDEDYCQTCGRGTPRSAVQDGSGGGVMNRPRARTGISSSRFGAVS